MFAFAPIWPDDYIFFGQMLTYAWDEDRPHEDVPSHIVKSGSRLPNTVASNRVFRAPAYYRNAQMSIAHFNPNANLVAYSKPSSAGDTDLKAAYPNMTAIDFHGYHDMPYRSDFVTIAGSAEKVFFPPLLDDGGLQSIAGRDETKNLLIYAPIDTDNPKTYNVLTGAGDFSISPFVEPVFNDYFSGTPYNTVQTAPTTAISGHLVKTFDSGTGAAAVATNDHLLVDRQDFNCPIDYTFTGNHRMWYQRQSADGEFVDRQKGWQGISLPFTAEITSTQDKGELTHFYRVPISASADTGSTGHEYWLRQFGGTLTVKDADAGIFEADFDSPDAAANTKEYTNTYLWDYYYSQDSFKDLNEDTYREQYYREAHTFTDYPYLSAATPYILGLPGATYYEFDLSGTWTPANRYQNTTIANPGKQVVTFASPKNTSIGVSDTEIGMAPTGMAFRPNYLNTSIDADTPDIFTLAANGSSYDKVSTATTVAAFRPYFLHTTASPAPDRRMVEHIVFSSNAGNIGEHNNEEEAVGTLTITSRRHKVIATSTLPHPVEVVITNTAGITVATMTVEPGTTTETRMKTDGVYIIQTSDGSYNKKLIVK